MNSAEVKLACLAEGIEIIRETTKFVEAKRADGLTVFFDKFDESRPDADMLAKLNAVRLYAKPEDVIFMVGIVRGFQISMAYATRQGKTIDAKAYADSIPIMRQIAAGTGQRKRQRRIDKERKN